MATKAKLSKNVRNKGEKKLPSAGRRNLLNWLWIVLGGVALMEFTWLVFSFLRPGKPGTGTTASAEIIEAGRTDRFAMGTVTAFPRGRFYLARMEDGAFLAISRACTHLGCTVPWNEKEAKFICPCHASTFDITGAVLLSPAPRALDIYRIVIENDIIKVDTGKRIKRNAFTKKQLTYSDTSPGIKQNTKSEKKPLNKPNSKTDGS